MNSWIFREAVLNKVEHLIFFSCTVMYQSKDVAQSEADWSAADRIYSNYYGVGNTKVYLENMCDFYSQIGETIRTHSYPDFINQSQELQNQSTLFAR
jgi:nucleoside-diphosphate-sugar epimerase